MSIYAIGDLHLSLDKEKPMDIFGSNWKEHEKLLKSNWIKIVKEEDIILLPGDFSWAMNIKKMYEDFKYLNELPGRKLLLKGNHDYWWTTISSMRNFLREHNFKNIDFIYNNSYEYENKIIVGTRGWSLGDEEKSKKMHNREEARLQLSLQSGVDNYGEKEIICLMHYPPITKEQKEIGRYIEIMKKYNVKTCLYGHLHQISHNEAFEGEYKDINFKLVSSDYLKFRPYKILGQ